MLKAPLDANQKTQPTRRGQANGYVIAPPCTSERTNTQPACIRCDRMQHGFAFDERRWLDERAGSTNTTTSRYYI